MTNNHTVSNSTAYAHQMALQNMVLQNTTNIASTGYVSGIIDYPVLTGYPPNYSATNPKNFGNNSYFWAWQPKIPNNKEDIKELFQVNIKFENNVAHQKHLSIWRYCNPPWDEDKFLDENLDTTYGSTGCLSFYNKNHAIKFQDWWKRYVSFFDGTEWNINLYPNLKKGYVNGVYVEASTYENDKFEQWKWIVKNSVAGAVQLNKGWFFNLKEDASLFILTFKD
jgi:hypothetical protein